MFSFLRSVKLHPIEWSEAIRLTAKTNPFVGEVLDAAFSHARAVLVLMTPDETTRLLPEFVRENDPSHEREPGMQPRPNVLFEAGMAMGRSPDRTVLVQLGETRLFSDIAGRRFRLLAMLLPLLGVPDFNSVRKPENRHILFQGSVIFNDAVMDND